MFSCGQWSVGLIHASTSSPPLTGTRLPLRLSFSRLHHSFGVRSIIFPSSTLITCHTSTSTSILRVCHISTPPSSSAFLLPCILICTLWVWAPAFGNDCHMCRLVALRTHQHLEPTLISAGFQHIFIRINLCPPLQDSQEKAAGPPSSRGQKLWISHL